MPDGGILSLELDEFNVNEDLSGNSFLKAGSYIVMKIEDTGEGISKENLSHIFDPYFTTKPSEVGTGLSLAIVHNIVKEHGGNIRVYSEVNIGTIFQVYLPLHEKEVYVEKDIKSFVLGNGEKNSYY